ncbi:MAG: hypothetical protein GXY38_02145 [Planctomycetes bacterium]|nr:hypothetical protein [Planctomycetota bacterium]
MSGQDKNPPRLDARQPAGPSRTKNVLLLVTPIILLAAVVAGYVTLLRETSDSPTTVASNDRAGATKTIKFGRAAKTLDELLSIPVEKLGEVDIAEMNLLCAVGLPGSEELDIDHALATLDQWAAKVAFETNRHLYRVADPRYADHYRHSEAYLRAEFLVQVLCEDVGVKYNLAAKDNFDFKDSRVAFIHGMIPMPGETLKDAPGGTCASMPVMVTAVGRRLGYPLKLATTQGHIFVRWDGQNHANPAWRERFNMEVTNGFASFEDDYYKTWPFKLSDYDVQANRYLLSLSPQEELTEFLAARGHCGLDNGQIAFAARCYENACRYDMTRPACRAWLVDAAMKCDYKPTTPVLARELTQRMRPHVARRDPLAVPTPGDIAPSVPDVPGIVPTRIGQWRQPHLLLPGVPQPPSPYAPKPPQPGTPQPGFPNYHQTYQLPVPGQPR